MGDAAEPRRRPTINAPADVAAVFQVLEVLGQVGVPDLPIPALVVNLKGKSPRQIDVQVATVGHAAVQRQCPRTTIEIAFDLLRWLDGYESVEYSGDVKFAIRVLAHREGRYALVREAHEQLLLLDVEISDLSFLGPVVRVHMHNRSLLQQIAIRIKDLLPHLVGDPSGPKAAEHFGSRVNRGADCGYTDNKDQAMQVKGQADLDAKEETDCAPDELRDFRYLASPLA